VLKTFVLSLILLVPSLYADKDRAATAAQVRKDAAITFTGNYAVNCPRELVQKALDHPALLGALWASYGYAPTYKVTELEESGAVHVVDPTGIVGDLWRLERKGHSRVYLAEGKIDHWAVPALNGGRAVFEVETVARDSLTQVKVKVFLEADSGIASAVLWVLEPIAIKHIDNRISLNFEDAARIMETIHRRPERVSARLKGELLREFERVF
jgi:hypothetical protein